MYYRSTKVLNIYIMHSYAYYNTLYSCMHVHNSLLYSPVTLRVRSGDIFSYVVASCAFLTKILQ